MTEVEQQPQTNGIETIEEDDSNKVRPADIEAVSSLTDENQCSTHKCFKQDFLILLSIEIY